MFLHLSTWLVLPGLLLPLAAAADDNDFSDNLFSNIAP